MVEQPSPLPPGGGEKIRPDYKGKLVVAAMLYKNKWNATIGIIFGRYIIRYFVLNLDNSTFSSYTDETCATGENVYSLEVRNSLAQLRRVSNGLKISP